MKRSGVFWRYKYIMITGERSDPFKSFKFRVEIGGMTVALVSEVTGLQAETETEIYEEGGVNDFVHLLPKKTKYPRMILKRGITQLDDMWKWYQDVIDGWVERKNGSIILVGINGKDRLRWDFSRAYPVKWSGPEFKADSSAVAFESIELVHQGFKKG